MKAPELKAPYAMRGALLQLSLKLKAPELKAPELKAPELKAPELKAPELKAPELKAPELKAPELKAPYTMRGALLQLSLKPHAVQKADLAEATCCTESCIYTAIQRSA
jgi:hypothetical protein